MTNKRFKFWTKWLLYANIMTLFVGLLAAFAGNSVLFELHNQGTRQTFFNGESLPPNVLALKNWLFGIIGGTIVGFHILMLFIIRYSFSKREPWAYWALLVGLLSWFCIDSMISFAYRAYYNIYFINLVALLSIGLPLLVTRKEFLKS
jgi:hypothetical protein